MAYSLIEIAYDSFLAALIFPIRAEILYPALLAFGHEQILLPTLAALFGSVLGLSANFAAVLLLIKLANKRTPDFPAYITWLRYAILLGVWHATFGPVLAAASALFGARYLLFFPLIICVKLLEYGYLYSIY